MLTKVSSKYVLILYVLLLFFSCTRNSTQVLRSTRHKMDEANYLSYDQLAFYPNPIGKIDTLRSNVEISKRRIQDKGIDFVIRSGNITEVMVDGNYKSIFHKDSLIKFFPKANKAQEKIYLEQNRNIKYSPLSLLRNESWKFKMDTVIDYIDYMDYNLVENDTIIDGNSIYTELHLFVDPNLDLPQLLERRNFFNGQFAQSVKYKYSNFKISSTKRQIKEQQPVGYRSIPFGENRNKIQFIVGQKAPDFEILDISDRKFSLTSFKNKKILLIFSIINCGYCESTIEQLKLRNYELADNVMGLYINTLDTKNDVMDYVEEKNIPFPVFVNGNQIVDLFGVTAFPTFFLINEVGIIEQVKLGYDKEFITGLLK